MKIQPYAPKYPCVRIRRIFDPDLPEAIALLIVKDSQTGGFVGTVQAAKRRLTIVDVKETFGVENRPVEIYFVWFKRIDIVAVDADNCASRAFKINLQVADACMFDIQRQIYIKNFTRYRHKNIF